MPHAHQITDAAQALKFIMAGNARVTLESVKTANRYTYKISEAKERPGEFFVSLLTGQDNESDYTYMGMIRAGLLSLTRASTYTRDSAPFKALSWALTGLATRREMPDLNIWHEGRCGRCNRTLTTPESIAQGFGPECIKNI